ncbi:hypothetical protein SLEP1_g28642 [Rubroshorea leprosula]|uniref:Uncharacterized protein n=1 Tax=Rubroshorea leprosula TaxID=152421 RepID=A0AAV5K1F2_9ROSI|nr:hypothetical protein SLEP1_g28642 [Rubroshorea leprosula]
MKSEKIVDVVFSHWVGIPRCCIPGIQQTFSTPLLLSLAQAPTIMTLLPRLFCFIIASGCFTARTRTLLSCSSQLGPTMTK